MAPNLEKCFTMRAYLGKSDTVTLETPDSPTKKVILPLESGWIQGSGLKAELMPGGSDWNTVSTTHPLTYCLTCTITQPQYHKILQAERTLTSRNQVNWLTKEIQMNPALKTAHVNVRTQARIPSSGHGIYMHYVGILHLDDAATNVTSSFPLTLPITPLLLTPLSFSKPKPRISILKPPKSLDPNPPNAPLSSITPLTSIPLQVLTYSPSAKTTQYSDHTWFSQPRIETSDPAFKWVESSMFVGEGRFIVDEKGTAVEYEIYKVIK